MSDAYIVAVEGLGETRASLEALPRDVQLAAVQAVNKAADRASAESRRRIRSEVSFPAQYLTGQDSSGRQRLGITKRARGDDLEAVITGRHRPTSLARFVTSGRVGKAGVTVQVAPGFARMMRRAFLIRLPAGSGAVETKTNQALALRLKPGEKVENKRLMIPLKPGSNLYLLYGPSVDQVFKNVAADVSPDTLDFLETEFARLLELKK